MSIYEEKKWLRAVLEGKIKPGDVEWERISKEEEFAEIRRILHHVDQMNFNDRPDDLEQMWHVVEAHRKDGSRRQRYILLRRWVAAVVVLLVVGGGLTLVRRNFGEQLVVSQAVLPKIDSTQVTLIMAGGEQINLSRVTQDTTFQQGNVKVHMNASKGLTYQQEGKAERAEMNQVVVPRKCEYQITLEDGTKVFLNAGSKLRYPTFFAGNTRQVFLEGEAYFEVARDTNCPFLVETVAQSIQVLGTSFNVYAYPDEIMNYAVLVSGSVAVKDKQTGADHLLLPGQQVALDVTTGSAFVKEVDVQQVIAWKNGMLVFDDLSLEQIMEKLSRWYDVNVFYRNPEVKGYVFKGNMPRYDTLDAVLKELEKVSKVKFDVNNHVITISL